MDFWYIKLHRKTLEWEWYSDINTSRLFLHLLLTVNYEEKKWRGVVIPKWSRITWLTKLSEETGLTIQNIRTSLTKLKSTGEITDKTTSNYRHIQVQNWQEYQDQLTGKLTGKQQATNRRLTATKEIEEIKEIETYDTSIENAPEKKLTPNEIAQKFFATDPEEILSSLSVEPANREIVLREIIKFISYWTEPNKSGTRQLWQTKPTFEVSRRLRTWFDRAWNKSVTFTSYQKSHANFD